MTTDDSVILHAPLRGGTAIGAASVNIITNCTEGYSLTLNTISEDNYLYPDGDASYRSTPGSYIAPSDGVTALDQAPNTWGYLLSPTTPSSSSVFLPVPSSLDSPAILKTPASTASETPIDDTFNIYYGVSTSSTLAPGSYRMPSPSGSNTSGFSYFIAASPTCADNLEIDFNQNLDGSGGEGTDSSLANFPTSSDNIIDSVNHTLTLSSKTPTRDNYIFKEWNISANGNGATYHPGDVITMGAGGLSGFVTLYAVWVEKCSSATVCYDGNHADAGTMNNQTGTAGNAIALIPPNFSRSGYAFLGWSENPNAKPNGTDTIYGPNQNITLPASGINLFAVWLAPTGTLQTWANPNSLDVGEVIALRDNRDDEVYMVAKLADNNVWITENYRLVPTSDVTITEYNTNSPTSEFLTKYKTSSPSEMCSNDNATCDDSVQYNTNNINRNLTPSFDTNDNSSSWYSYGVMYNWYTATAGNGTYSKNSGSVTGDICPAGWHLPTGGSGGEWGALNTAVNNGVTNRDTGLRAYPVNIIHSGDYNHKEGGGTGRGTQGRIWSATAASGVNAFRMGYSASDASATNKSWNKWDGFAVRCIYQGGNIPYHNVNVNFAGTGITSLTLTNPSYPTITATPSNPSISLAENATYTVTAAVNTGYEVDSWATTANGTLGDSTTTSPAVNPNTYTITEEATLTVTGAEIPSYAVTTTIGEHVTSISFMNGDYGTTTITPSSASCTENNNTYTCSVNLRRGVSYTISATYEEGYTIDTWTTSEGGILGNATDAVTTFTITSATTLGLTATEADELTYTIVYSAGSGTGAPAGETKTSYNNTESFTITNLAPIYYGYTLTGWSETHDANNNGTTVDYVSGDTITVTSTGTTTTKTLYPVYSAVSSCPANKICYYENGADVNNGGRGTMSNQSASSNSSANLIPTNYSKTGYGFAGWATSENATPYGPNATITTPDISSSGLALYAKWVESAGDLQSWRGCNAMSVGDVTALTDSRDNQTYAVAKLADGNCWTIENLRLVPSTATINSQNTHNPASNFASEAAVSSSANELCGTDNDATCINQIQYNTNSLNRSLTQSYNTASSSVAWYSYGVYYNWYTATAGNGTTNTADNTSVSGDLCPKNWHLPTSTSSGEWAALNTAANSGLTNADAGLRAFPTNLIWSGDYNKTSRTSGYSNGRYWSATSYSAGFAYRMGHQESGSKGSTPSGNYSKWDAFAVRCIRDEVTAEYNDVTVTFPANVTSITFTNAGYGTETATPSSPTVSIVQGATYTITANLAPGYELDEWTTGPNSTIGSTSQNPTTLSITDDTTLTLTVDQIPSYTVTVNFDSGVSSIGFYNETYGTQQVTTSGSTVTLYNNIPYTISSSYTGDYTIDHWSTTANGTLESTTSKATTYTVTGTATLTLTSKERTGQATLLPGQELNAKMKTLAEGRNIESYEESSKIKVLRMADSLPEGFTPSSANTVSVSGSEKPIYIFFDNTNNVGIMYFYTDAKDIYMNPNSSYAFKNNTALTDISALSIWDTSSVTNMSNMFASTSALTNIDALSSWDTSSVTNMNYMFSEASALTNINGASNWDVSNVTDMNNMFYYATSLINIDGVSNWDVSNVTDMSNMFYNATSLINIDGVSNWDVSSVINMNGLFCDIPTANIDALANWNTSSVINMGGMFGGASALINLDALANWDTSSVREMGSMFAGASALINLDALANWDTSNVHNMTYMFSGTISLTDASGADNWDIRNVTATAGSTSISSNNFHSMFFGAGGDYSSPNHPNFTMRSGTWDIEGTFIPGNTVSSTVAVTVIFDSNISNMIVGNNTISTSGSTVSLNTNYSFRIAATLNTGYELALWDPGEHGLIPVNRLTINSITDDPTYFTPTADTTLTATSQPIPSDITTTVNIDSNIKQVSFCNDKYNTYNSSTSTYDCAVASSNGSNVTLKQGATYRVTTTTKSGYEVSSYSATSATITSTAGPHTDFTPSGNSTLSITSTTNTPTHTVTVNMDSNVSYITFTNPNWPSKTAVRNGNTVDLRENTSYIITAYTNNGYELTSWSTTANGTLGSTTTNPTTYIVTGDSTLTSTSRGIPYTVTVNLDEHSSSISFYNADYGTQTITNTNSNGDGTHTGTVSLRRGVEYTLSSSFASGYKLNSWITTANGTIGDSTSQATTYTITGIATLSLSSNDSQAMDNADCPANSICYVPNANDIVGSMSSLGAISGYPTAGKTTNAGATPELIAPNYSRPGYGFAGWSTDFNATTSSTIYGPNETLANNDTTKGLILYPVWIASVGNLQDTSKVTQLCSTGAGSLTQATYNSTTGKMEATLSSMSALTDQRDGNVYTIAKLADGKCWMTENLRIEADNTIGDTNKNLSQGYGTSATYGDFTGLATSENANFADTTTANSLYSIDGSTANTIKGGSSFNYGYRFPRYNNNNTNRNLDPSYNGTGDTTYYQWHSYGNYYSWPAAMANVKQYNSATSTDDEGKTSETANTSICPSGWRLPYGNSTGNGATAGGFSYLDTRMGGTGTDQTSTAGTAQSKKWRSFPNNFVYSGYFTTASADNRGTYGRYWSSTANNYYRSCNLTLYSTYLYPGTVINNKYYGQSIRCVYLTQSTITVSLDSNISSITFSDGTDTQTATSSNPTVTLIDNRPYTITANAAAGYELASWSTTSGGTLGSTTTNPTTYTVTEAATLSATSQVRPTYTTTVNLDEHSSSVSFYNADYGTQTITNANNNGDGTHTGTVTLYRGIEYTLSSSFASGYKLNSWTTTANGTLGDPTSQATTYTVNGTATLDLSSKNSLILEESDCPANSICYAPNATGIEGSMSSLGVISGYPTAGKKSGVGATLILIAPNYSRPGYGFAGWSTDFNATTSSTIYGPNETLENNDTTKGLILYPVWIASAGNLQDTSKVAELCGTGAGSLTQATYNSTTGKMNATLSSMSALTDQRDGNVYTIAKLADGKCWMTENLRIEANDTIGDTNKNLSQGYGTSATYGNFTGLATSENANFADTTTANSLYSIDGSTANTIQGGSSSYYGYRFPRYNNNNTNRNLNPSYNGTGSGTYYQWHSYGNYYTWPAAMANVKEYTSDTSTDDEGKTSETANTSICPAGWRLPYGNDTGNGATAGGFSYLDTRMGGTGTEQTSAAGRAQSEKWRSFPNNFVYSGDFNTASAGYRGTDGSYWSSTVYGSNISYHLSLGGTYVYPGANISYMHSGQPIRCVLPYTQFTVTVSLDPNISSITFSDGTDTQTATSSNPTVTLIDGKEYTITANGAAGYELASWSTTSGGTLGSTTTNPTTYTVTGTATLSATSQAIPSYTTTVNLDEHSSSVSFYNADYGTQTITNANNNGDGTHTGTVSLRRDVEYTLSSSFASGYKFSSWTTTANGTLGDPTNQATTYTVNGTATLSLGSKNSLILEESDCPAYSICYAPNASDIVGSMSSLGAVSGYPTAGKTTNTTPELIAPNYSRPGYGFAGWSTDFNATTSSTIYGPNETLANNDITKSLILYPVWIASAGYLQDNDKVAELCDTGSGSLTQATYNSTTGKMEATLSSMSALTDQRDGNVYTIAKLADGKCWMTENLRIEANNTIGGTNKNLSQGYGTSTTYGNFTGLATSENANFDTTNPPLANSLYSTDGSTTNTIQGGNSSYYYARMPRYNNNNTNRNLDPSYNGTGDTTYYQWHSYGNYYTWPAAMANVKEYTSATSTDDEGKTSETANTSICPSGWRLPYGRNTGNGAIAGGFSYLDTRMGGTGATQSSISGTVQSKKWRSFPNNFVYSGYFITVSASNRSTYGHYWSSTANYYYDSYGLNLGGKYFYPGTSTIYKHSGQSIRCVLPYTQFTVTVSLDSNISSITFSDGTDTQTATSSNPTVTLIDGKEYTITANGAAGYELASWSTTSGGTLGSTTTNPTTYTVTEAATLSATSQVRPSYTTTVNLDEHSSSVSFYNADYGTQTITNANNNGDGTHTGTVTLYRGIEYTLSSSFASGYKLNSWTTTANGTLGDPTNQATTYTVTGTATLSLGSKDSLILYDTDCPANSICYAPNTNDVVGTMVTGTGTRDLKSIPNYATAGRQTTLMGNANTAITSNSTPTLVAPNYSRSGYGFAGWSKDFDATSSSTIYGPNQTITVATDGTGDADVSTNGLILYPVWIASAGYLQDNNKVAELCGAGEDALTQATYNSTTGKMEATLSSMSALTDQRDGNVYTIAKLADGKCWMTENLRIEADNTIGDTNKNLSQGYGTSNTYGDFTGLATSENANFGTTTANSLYSTDGSTANTIKGNSYLAYRFPRYNNNNTNRNLNPSYNRSEDNTYYQWHSYGNYYTWAAAMASVKEYSGTTSTDDEGKTSETANTSICPSGWRLPYGDNTGNGATAGGFSYLDTRMGGTGASQSSTAGTAQSKKWRSFPNNYIYSGYYQSKNSYDKSVYGFYWASTSRRSDYSYYLVLNNESINPGTSYYKDYGHSIRCILPYTQYTVTVSLDSHLTGVTFTDPDGNTISATSENPTVKLKEGVQYTIAANREYGYQLASWSTTANGTLGSTTDDPTTYTVTGTATLTATSEIAGPMRLTYDGNGLTFNNDATTNTVSYNATRDINQATAYYAHTANIDDSGVATGTYANSLRTKDVVTVPGATNLSVILYYSTQNGSDKVFPIKGEYTGTVSQSMSVTGQIGTYQGGAKTTFEEAERVRFNVEGDTVTFAFYSNNSTAYYGYYAIVVGIDSNGDYINTGSPLVTITDYDKTVATGSYAIPNSSSPHDFLGWSEDRNATTPTYLDEADIKKNYPKVNGDNVTLYAIYNKYLTIHFDGNGNTDSATMNDQTIRASSSATLRDNIFTKTKHTFTGWNTEADGTGTRYSNKASFSAPANTTLGQELTLYAQWIEDETVTVNFDGPGITKVTLSNDTYGTQTITSSGSTAIMRKGLNYTITATISIGNEFINWSTATNGTITSATTNPTTYVATGDTTLTITSAVIPSYTVTVNMDEHVSSVGFYSSDYGTQQATNNGDTVSLRRDASYIITSSYDSGYALDSWGTTANGTLGATDVSATTYVVTDTATLTISSKVVTSMTAFDGAACNAMSIGDTTYLYDSRDSKTYKIAKLADNNCWMLDNLALDLTDSSVQANLSSTTTNASDTTLNYLINGGGTSPNPANGVSGSWTSSSQNSHVLPYINTTNKDNMPSTKYGSGANQIGVYYNYCAASAGSYCYSSSSSLDIPDSIIDATEDICPAGWRLPTGNTNSDYYLLSNAITGSTSTSISGTNATNFRNALSTTLSGYYYSGSVSYQNSRGYFWTSTYNSAGNMSVLYTTTSSVNTANSDMRSRGIPIRCILDSSSNGT